MVWDCASAGGVGTGVIVIAPTSSSVSSVRSVFIVT